jgi:hypothetical protein
MGHKDVSVRFPPCRLLIMETRLEYNSLLHSISSRFSSEGKLLLPLKSSFPDYKVTFLDYSVAD